MTTAKHRAVDCIRRNARLEHKTEVLGRELEIRQETAEMMPTRRSTTTCGDDLLRLIFMACHPVLSTEARVALTLRLLGGLTTDEIARAFLVCRSRPSRSASSAPSARWPRRTCRSRSPAGAERAARLRVGAGGHLPHLQRGLLGDGRRRSGCAPALCEDALRLGRILAELVPGRPKSTAWSR